MSMPHVAQAELAVLQLLWEHGQLTARQITQHLYPKQTTSDVATVQKLLQRLETKELITRDRTHFVHFIVATVSRNEYASRTLAETARQLAGGSLKPLLAHLVETEELTAEELDELRKLVNKQRRKS